MTPIETVVAKQAIGEVLYRYCRGIDRMDRALVLSCWHPDGTADYGEAYSGSASGFVDWVWPLHREWFVAHSHQVANMLIEVSGDGRTAASEAYVTVAMRVRGSADGPSELVGRGRYLDRWSCRDGQWRIDHRRHVVDLRTVPPAGTASDDAVPNTGSRGPDDPSYGVLGVLP